MKKKNVKGKDEWIDYISLIIALLIIIGVFLLVRVFDKSKPKGEYVGVSADGMHISMEFDDERVIVKYNYNYGHEEIKIFDYHVNHNLISGYVEMTDRSLGSDKNRYIRLYDNNEHFGDCRWDRKNQNIFYGDIVLQQK